MGQGVTRGGPWCRSRETGAVSGCSLSSHVWAHPPLFSPRALQESTLTTHGLRSLTYVLSKYRTSCSRCARRTPRARAARLPRGWARSDALLEVSVSRNVRKTQGRPLRNVTLKPGDNHAGPRSTIGAGGVGDVLRMRRGSVGEGVSWCQSGTFSPAPTPGSKRALRSNKMEKKIVQLV